MQKFKKHFILKKHIRSETSQQISNTAYVDARLGDPNQAFRSLETPLNRCLILAKVSIIIIGDDMSSPHFIISFDIDSPSTNPHSPHPHANPTAPNPCPIRAWPLISPCRHLILASVSNTPFFGLSEVNEFN